MNNKQQLMKSNKILDLLENSGSNYIGTKQVKAAPCSLGQYKELKGLELNKEDNPEDSGMLIQYQDNHISWSPLDVFDEAYKFTTGMNFGLAVAAMKKGHKVFRVNWNGDNMYAVIMPGYPYGIPCNEATSKQHGIPRGTYINFLPYFQLRNAQGDFVVYNPNTTDILAEDWKIKFD